MIGFFDTVEIIWVKISCADVTDSGSPTMTISSVSPVQIPVVCSCWVGIVDDDDAFWGRYTLTPFQKIYLNMFLVKCITL